MATQNCYKFREKDCTRVLFNFYINFTHKKIIEFHYIACYNPTMHKKFYKKSKKTSSCAKNRRNY